MGGSIVGGEAVNGEPVLGGGRGDDCMGKYNYVNLFQSILDT